MVRVCHLAVVSFSVGLLSLVPVGNVHAQSRAVIVEDSPRPAQPVWMNDWYSISEILSAALVTADLPMNDLKKAQADTLRPKWAVDTSRGVYYSNSLSVSTDVYGRLDVKYAVLWEGNPTNLTFYVKKIGNSYEIVERKVTVMYRKYKTR